jgi:hypothetical protein
LAGGRINDHQAIGKIPHVNIPGLEHGINGMPNHCRIFRGGKNMPIFLDTGDGNIGIPFIAINAVTGT